MKPATLAKCYIKAAQHLDRRHNQKYNRWFRIGACAALADKGIYRYDPNFKYLMLFRPEHKGHHDYWWRDPENCSDVDHNARVLALLFAAEIIKDKATS